MLRLSDFRFRDEPDVLTHAQRLVVVDQATLVLSQFYAHLPMKVARHAAVPLQRLELLRRQCEWMRDREFHDEMLRIFAQIRDGHVSYYLPYMFERKGVCLGFRVEEYYEDGARRYVVSRVGSHLRHASFRPGVEVTHWNGVPVDRAVTLFAHAQGAGNEWARRAQAVKFLTIRHLQYHLPPDEEWVNVRFLTPEGESMSLDVAWRAFEERSDGGGDGSGSARGVDSVRSALQPVEAALYASERPAVEEAGPAPEVVVDLRGEGEKLAMRYGTVTTPDGTFGYIRIFNFSKSTDQAGAVDEFRRVLSDMPAAGLVVDIRDNPGGSIAVGESLLQLLTPKTIVPNQFSFRCTPLTSEVCRRSYWDRRWLASIDRSLETGAVFSRGLPIKDDPNVFNGVGQIYYGPSILLVDALSFSTADMFAAGFQDHAIGPVLGTSKATAAGGGNNWSHRFLRLFFPSFIIDPGLEAGLAGNAVTPELRDAFAYKGIDLTDATTVSRFEDDDGVYWLLQDAGWSYTIRRLPWIDESLRVYYYGDGVTVTDLPWSIDFEVVGRTCTRVGDNTTVPLEDYGVQPQAEHAPTRRDVLGRNEDLLGWACRYFADRQSHVIAVADQGYDDDGTYVLRLEIENLTRVDAYVDDRPVWTGDVAVASVEIRLPVPGGAGGRVEIKGYSGATLVAAKRLVLPAP